MGKRVSCADCNFLCWGGPAGETRRRLEARRFQPLRRKQEAPSGLQNYTGMRWFQGRSKRVFELATFSKRVGCRMLLMLAIRLRHLSVAALRTHPQLAWQRKNYKIREARVLKMNSDQLEGKWKQVKGEVREKWGQLTDDDIHVIAGRRNQLIGRIQERYGIAKETATREVDTFLKKLNAETARDMEFDERVERAKTRGAGQP